MSDSVRPHRRQPTRLPSSWDSPGKSTGVGCRFLLQYMKGKFKVKSLSRVRLFETPWTAAYQAPPSMGGVLFPGKSTGVGCHCLLCNEAEVDVFLEFSCFFYDPTDVGNLVSGSSAFSKSTLNSWKLGIQVLLKPGFNSM